MHKNNHKNGNEKISIFRYLFGVTLFYIFHLKALLVFWLKWLRTKDKNNYHVINKFHQMYFKDFIRKLDEHRRIILSTPAKRTALLLLQFFFLFIFLTYFSLYEGPAAGYWDTYISAPALLMINRHVDYTDKYGTSLFDYTLPGKLPHNLVNPETYDVSSKDQRIGSAILFAPFTLLFNMFGFHFMHALIYTFAALLFFLTLKKLFSNICTSLLLTALLSLNTYVASLNHLNPNGVGLFFISLLLYFIFHEKKSWLLIGFLFGVFGGVRNVGILFTPALIFFILSDSKQRKRDLLSFFCSAFIAIVPILIWNKFAFNNPLMHPSQYSNHSGFRPVFEHTFFLWKFNFNGMFNFPLHSALVRTPYFAFPTFLTLPLILIRQFGLILTSIAILGFFNCFKCHKKYALFLALWFFPMVCMFLLQENWSEMKSTFLLLFLHPPILWMGYGLRHIFSLEKPLKSFIFIFSSCLLLFISLQLLRSVDFEVDQRWYQRFPRAHEEIMSFIGDDLRTETEKDADLKEQKKDLTKGNIFPSIKSPTITPIQMNDMRAELNQKSLRTIDFWKYIYGAE
jgi:hypothetical protein